MGHEHSVGHVVGLRFDVFLQLSAGETAIDDASVEISEGEHWYERQYCKSCSQLSTGTGLNKKNGHIIKLNNKRFMKQKIKVKHSQDVESTLI